MVKTSVLLLLVDSEYLMIFSQRYQCFVQGVVNETDKLDNEPVCTNRDSYHKKLTAGIFARSYVLIIYW